MLCMLSTFLCVSMVNGGQAFDWEEAISDAYDERNNAASDQDIPLMMNILSDNATFYPPDNPPLSGKQAVNDMYEEMLENGQWPEKMDLTFQKIIAKCETVGVAEHSTEAVLTDGKIYIGSGVRVFIRADNDNDITLVASIWNSHGPQIDANDS